MEVHAWVAGGKEAKKSIPPKTCRMMLLDGLIPLSIGVTEIGQAIGENGEDG